MYKAVVVGIRSAKGWGEESGLPASQGSLALLDLVLIPSHLQSHQHV